MKTVLILGSSGFLGAILSKHLKLNGFNVIRQSRSFGYDLHLSTFSEDSFTQALLRFNPDFIINLIACTNVDLCEKEPLIAYQANVLPVKELVASMQCLDCPPLLIHISTDQVYSGGGPHSEKSVNPLNVYGLSKYTSELIALGSNAIVLRTNFYGRSHTPGRKSLSDWLVESFRNKNLITVFDDVYFNALNINILCDLIMHCMRYPCPGTYNLGCKSGLSKAEFAFQLASQLSIPTSHVKVGTVSEARFNAKRPNDMITDVSLFESAFRVKLPTIQSQIQTTASEYIK